MEQKNYEEKNIKTGDAAKRKKPFWGKPNWFAALLVAVFLVWGWNYLGGDLIFYCQAWNERAVLAERAERAILDAADATPIDLSRVAEDAEKVNDKIQTLADKTDLGEFLAANDLNTEGREANKVVMYIIFTMFAAGVTYLMMQVIHVMVLIGKVRKRNKTNSCQGGAVA